MKQRIKVRWNEYAGLGMIQIRATSTARVEVDVIVTEDQIYGIVEAIRNNTLPSCENTPDKWREL